MRLPQLDMLRPGRWLHTHNMTAQGKATSHEFEYYVVKRRNEATTPLLDSDGGPLYLSTKGPVDATERLRFRFGKPVPSQIKMADYLSSPKSVVSQKIFEVLSQMQIDGIQLLPCTINGAQDYTTNEYWAVHTHHRLKCVDPEASEGFEADSPVALALATKIVLDKEILAAIPLEKRLAFRLHEDPSFELFHASIVEAIKAVNPDGVRFINIEQWSPASLFERG